jgi:hypothetical protein
MHPSQSNLAGATISCSCQGLLGQGCRHSRTAPADPPHTGLYHGRMQTSDRASAAAGLSDHRRGPALAVLAPALILAVLVMIPTVPGLAQAAEGSLGKYPVSSTPSAGRGDLGPIARTSVIGGNIAEPGTFPWMAFVFNQRVGFACSGTVIAPNLVLTAGHCAVNLETGRTDQASGYRVVTGNVNWAAPEREISQVSRVLVYPQFKIYGSMSGWGDAALLELSTPTPAPAIPLATSANAKRLHLGTQALIAGWGNTYFSQREPTEQLRWANTVVEGKRCNRLPEFRFEGGICTIDPPKFASGACNGDSGGPLLAAGSDGEGLIEIGITHGGYGRCLTRAPDLFTRADLISSWANHWISALNTTAPSTPTG